MRLRVGIQLPEVERDVRWPEYLALARAAEQAGFDSIWVGDHLLYRAGERGPAERGPWEAWTLLAALAAVTARVRLGPLVACAGFHPPALLAKMAATIDEISAGRFMLGLGAGWNEAEFRAFGIPFEQRVARFEEAFAIIHRLVAGGRASLAGRFHSVADCVLLPAPHRRVPLMIGSNGPRMLRIALPHVDAWNTWYDAYGNTAAGFADLNATIDAAAREAGRDPGEIARSACVLVELDATKRERAITVEAPPLTGPPERIAAALRELADAGADEAILVASPINQGSIRELGQALRALRTERRAPGAGVATGGPGREASGPEAARLRDRLAEIEVEHATLEAEIAAFHTDYMHRVGTLMAQVLDLEARVLDRIAERSGAPGDREAARDAKARARQSTAELDAVPEAGSPVAPPTDDLKKLFRDAAKRMHPDLAGDGDARTHAEAFMKRLNDAYRAGDGTAIVDLLEQWIASPYAAPPPGTEGEEASTSRELDALRAAVSRAERRLEELRGSELATMLDDAMAAAASGGDLLAQMRITAEARLAAAQARLASLE